MKARQESDQSARDSQKKVDDSIKDLKKTMEKSADSAKKEDAKATEAEAKEAVAEAKEAVKECWFSQYVSRLEPNRFFRWLTERASLHLLGRPSGMRRAAGRDLGRVQFHLRAFASPVWHALLPRDESQRGGGFKRYAHSAGPSQNMFHFVFWVFLGPGRSLVCQSRCKMQKENKWP